MPTTDQRLLAEAHRLSTTRHARTLTHRWVDDPHLAHRNPADIIEIVANPAHPHNNPTLAQLIHHSQHRDTDATILTLAGLRLGLWAVAHQHCRHHTNPYDELLTHTTLIVARINPNLDQLHHRILGRARAAIGRTPRHHHTELLTADPIDRPTGHDPVGDQVQARLTLAHLHQLAANMNPATWHALIATRVHGIPTHQLNDERTTPHLRADTSRLARHLQHLTAA